MRSGFGWFALCPDGGMYGKFSSLCGCGEFNPENNREVDNGKVCVISFKVVSDVRYGFQ